MSNRSPVFTSAGSRLYVHETRSWVPGTSSPVMVTHSPVRHSTGPPANLPSRIFGPCRSARMPTALPVASAASRTNAYTFSWSEWLPWLKFSRARSMPASTRPRIRSGVAVAGPMVQTIFARRVTVVRLAVPPGAGTDDP